MFVGVLESVSERACHHYTSHRLKEATGMCPNCRRTSVCQIGSYSSLSGLRRNNNSAGDNSSDTQIHTRHHACTGPHMHTGPLHTHILYVTSSYRSTWGCERLGGTAHPIGSILTFSVGESAFPLSCVFRVMPFKGTFTTRKTEILKVFI